ncbi:MAG TPA: hypothetical protein VFR28_06895 [Allosphingosinicella sp.]|jgi:hypothetical protein|nr:hypothetical protein [Allosphingosinicella sp.]
MSRPFLLLIPLLLAACGAAEEDDRPRANSVEELENRLEKLADRTSEDIETVQRLAFLKEADLGAEFRANPACRLHRDRRLLLVVNAAGAVARIDGRRAALAVSGPVGPTGGFFTAPGITVSVGRVESSTDGAAEYGQGWPARVTIGGDRERPIEKQDATWICVR